MDYVTKYANQTS